MKYLEWNGRMNTGPTGSLLNTLLKNLYICLYEQQYHHIHKNLRLVCFPNLSLEDKTLSPFFLIVRF